jgi:NAD(P)-dependent dehydrogenase (short-subunit alcohol dehydrogenase family)
MKRRVKYGAEAMGKLDGKVAIVTGAGRGIGRAIARDFAREGCRVVVASRSASTVASVVSEVESDGGTALGVTVDVAERDQIVRMVAETIEHFGQLDILVNNAQSFGTSSRPAGSPGHIALEEFPEDVWDFTFQTGLKATLFGMQAAFPHMRERGGKIINFGSGNGIGAMKGTAAYNSTKEAIRALTRTAAAEWGKYDICVNVIIPTMITDSAEAFFEARPGIREKLAQQIPLRRFGDVDRDIGPVAVFLASSDSGFVTGQAIHVDGGQILRP